ncbi:MAG TPA: triple tyrosine motif-containing protein, partial [Bacteroidia bacterium]|nr:triple tyrosine motif-containing protein [Bacteroidia bacterium]
MKSKKALRNKRHSVVFFPGMLLIIINGFYAVLFQMKAYSQTESSYITSYKTLSVEEGLSSREVFCGLQGKKGFIWLGTRNGLCRYDGEHFRQWHRKHGLRKEVIVQLAQDEERNVWILYGNSESTRNTDSVVDIMDNYTFEILPFSKRFPSAPFKETELMWAEANENDEMLLFVAPNRIYRYRKKEGFEKVCEVPMEKKELPNNIFFSHHHCWMRMPCQFIYINLNSGKKQSVTIDKWNFTPLTVGENGNCTVLSYTSMVSGNHVVKPGYTHISTDGKLRFISEPDIVLPAKDMLPQIMNDYNVRHNSSTLYFPRGGIFLFFKKTGQLLVPANELKDVKPFKLHCSFTDRQDQYWLPTNNGVLIVNNRKNRFEHYFTRQQIEAPGEDANPVRGIYADTSGNVYATILKNLMWHNTTGNIKPFLTDGHNFSLLRTGDYLVSGNAKKMTTYHLSSSKINPYMGSGKADVWSMMEVAPGKILFNSSGQLFTWIVASDKIHSCPQKEKSVLGDIYRLFRTSDNKIYAASDKGMYVLNEEGCLAEHYHSKATDPAHRIPVDGLHWIFEDAHGVFWFLTANDGLYRWNKKENSQPAGNKNLTERFRHFTMEDGLSSNVLYCMLQDERGYLWMSSDFGLMRMDTLSFEIKTFTTANGLSHNEFNRISCFKAANGKMYFGGLNGVNAFNPKDFWNDTTDYDLPVQIISFSQFNSVSNKLEDRTQQLLVENKIELQPEDKFMELKFMLLDYDFSPNRYAYRIDGIDNDWVYISENSIRLTDLPPGKFILRIKGQNQEGNWSPREQIIPITVYAPFYKTIWFMIFCLAALCFAIFLFFRRRTRNIIKAKNWLEQTVSQRTTQMRKLVSEKEMLMK